MTWYLSGQILLHIMPGNKDPTLEPSTLQLQVLPLSPEQVGLLLRLADDISNISIMCSREHSETEQQVGKSC